MSRTCLQIQDDRTAIFEGRTYHGIDDEGVYFVDPAAHGDVPLPIARRPLAEAIGPRACVQPVRLALVDYVDCAGTTHGFHHGEANPSRVLNLNGQDFRVTAAPKGFDLFWYSYLVATDPTPGVPHLIVAETINDQERYTGVALTHPRPGAWGPPFVGEPACPASPEPDGWGNCFSYCQEPDCFHPDVGVASYTGRDYALDGQTYNIKMLFYPKMDPIKVTVSSSGWYNQLDENSGGAVSRIWIYKLLDPVTDRLPALVPPTQGRERRVGIYMTHPLFFYMHHGVPMRTAQHRQQSLSIMLDTLAFAGFNWIEYNAINGSDRAGAAWYDSSYYHQLGDGHDLLQELPPLAQERGFGLVPVITSLTLPNPPQTVQGIEFSDDSFQRRADGEWVRAFNNRAPDPLRPEVQDWLRFHLEEIAVRSADKPAVKGLGFRVNGKIGLCYQAHQDSTLGAKQSGYSTWNLERFKAATGSEVPTKVGLAYDWLMERPDEWERWIDYRCQMTADFWLRMRDVIRAHRPDWNLYVKIVLPSEMPGTNVEWVDQGFTAIELLKHHGYDPALFTDEEGIVIEQTMMVDQDRFFTRVRWGDPHGSNEWAYKQFHFQPELHEQIRTAQGKAVELYHNYWEESFHPEYQYGDHLRTHTGTGPGRAFFEPATLALRMGNVDTLAFMGWQRPILAHEHTLRAFSTAFRALPMTDPVEVDGSVEPDLPEIWVRWFGDRLAVINDLEPSLTVRVTLDQPVDAGLELRDVASGHVFLAADATQRTVIEIPMEGWSLRTLMFVNPADDFTTY